MSVMHIVLCRKPIKGTVAANVVEHGTGGLNVDGCRVDPNGDVLVPGGNPGGTKGWNRPFMHDKEAMEEWADKKKKSQAKATLLGRFPANVILSHHPECVCVGKKNVKSNGHWIAPTNGTLYELGIKNDGRDEGNKLAEGGKESVEAWECHDDCPIRKLDEQSGVTKSTGGKGSASGLIDNDSIYGKFSGENKGISAGGIGDTGGASRFFKSIQEE